MKIDIYGYCGEGKTTVALLLRRILEEIGHEVNFVNPDAPDISESFLQPEALIDLAKRKMKPIKINITETTIRKDKSCSKTS